MGKYIKKFNDHTQYEVYISDTENLILPNVSLCINQKEVHYNPIIGVSGIEINKTELSLKQGDSETLEVSILPANASNKNVIWTSNDESVATVDENGTVTVVGGEGNAIITATTVDGGYNVECEVAPISYKIIKYTASTKLSETTSTSSASGLHINSFSGNNGLLTITSHTFNNNGVGIIKFNGDITSIGNYAFYNCSSLTSINIPDSVTSIGHNAFYNCSALKSINIPNGVASISYNSFRGCSSLTSITIPNSVTSINDSAFYNCSGLTSITIPNSVTSIGNMAFMGTTSLDSVHISDLKAWCGINFGNSIASPMTYAKHLYLNGEEVKDLEIPSSVTSISNYAFYSCDNLTSVTIPDSVTTIGILAFDLCRNITSCTIGNNVRSINNLAFGSCFSLASIDIPNSVTTIGTDTFNGCSSLTTCILGSGITTIGNNTFNGCSSLTSIVCNATAAPTIGTYTFSDVKSGGTLTVPTGSTGYDAWMSTSNYYLGKYGWTKVEQ